MRLECDALVVGGGAAGLSAALVLGRARVRTLLVDAGEQSNRPAPAVGGLLGHDGSLAVGAVEGRAAREHRDGRLAVLGAAHAALRARLVREWSDDVIVLAEGLGEEERAELAAADVPLDERPVAGLEAEETDLRAVRFADGDRLECDGILVAAPLVPRDDLAARLGCELTETPMATGLIATDKRRRTTVDGVFAAGDAAAMLQQVSGAIAAGSEAAVSLHHSLVPGLPG